MLSTEVLWKLIFLVTILLIPPFAVGYVANSVASDPVGHLKFFEHLSYLTQKSQSDASKIILTLHREQTIDHVY